MMMMIFDTIMVREPKKKHFIIIILLIDFLMFVFCGGGGRRKYIWFLPIKKTNHLVNALSILMFFLFPPHHLHIWYIQIIITWLLYLRNEEKGKKNQLICRIIFLGKEDWISFEKNSHKQSNNHHFYFIFSDSNQLAKQKNSSSSS